MEPVYGRLDDNDVRASFSNLCTGYANKSYMKNSDNINEVIDAIKADAADGGGISKYFHPLLDGCNMGVNGPAAVIEQGQSTSYPQEMKLINAILTSPPCVTDFLKCPPCVADFFSTTRYKQISLLKPKHMDIDGFSTLQLVLIDNIILFIPLKQAIQYNLFNSCWVFFCSRPSSYPPQ